MNDFFNPTATELSVGDVVLNLALATLLAALLAWHFIKFGTTFSNRRKFALVLPAITLTTVLVISVVKASLALSLGLVGALSIVRFRTPVKEPEELSYLFLAIATGLALGADQRFITLVAIPFILVVLTVKSILSRRSKYPNLYLNIEVPSNGSSSGILEETLAILTDKVPSVDMRRFDLQDGNFAGTFYLDCKNVDEVTAVQRSLETRFPDAAVTFVEQSSTPGV